MSDPFRELASVLEARMGAKAKKAVSGVPCELGTMTGSGLKLDTFKHEIQDFMVADWLVKIHFPAFSLVGTATSPVDSQGIDQPGASTSELTRYDFLPAEVEEVRLELKPHLNAGDRVLAIPVNDGREAVIVAKVVS